MHGFVKLFTLSLRNVLIPLRLLRVQGRRASWEGISREPRRMMSLLGE